jgi:hypothetical protein
MSASRSSKWTKDSTGEPDPEEPMSIERIREQVHEAAASMPLSDPPPPDTAVAAPDPEPERITEEEGAEMVAVLSALREKQQAAHAAQETAMQRAGEARDAQAIANHVVGRIAAKYGLDTERDSIDDDRTIRRGHRNATNQQG